MIYFAYKLLWQWFFENEGRFLLANRFHIILRFSFDMKSWDFLFDRWVKSSAKKDDGSTRYDGQYAQVTAYSGKNLREKLFSENRTFLAIAFLPLHSHLQKNFCPLATTVSKLYLYVSAL